MNVVNFTDGVDGLAAGVCTIAAATFAVIALSLDRDEAGILAALTAGAALGFLWHNFHPASIFMGDAGSNLLGLLLACVAIQGVLKTAAVVALFFPLVILAVPAWTRASWWPSGSSTAGRSTRPTTGTSTTASQHRLLAAAHGALPVRLDAVDGGAGAGVRFVPYSDNDGHLDSGWTLVIAAFGLIAVAASVYLVLVLEILKFRRFRERELRRQVETGEISALSASRSRGDRARGRDRRVPGGAPPRDRRVRRPAR